MVVSVHRSVISNRVRDDDWFHYCASWDFLAPFCVVVHATKPWRHSSAVWYVPRTLDLPWWVYSSYWELNVVDTNDQLKRTVMLVFSSLFSSITYTSCSSTVISLLLLLLHIDKRELLSKIETPSDESNESHWFSSMLTFSRMHIDRRERPSFSLALLSLLRKVLFKQRVRERDEQVLIRRITIIIITTTVAAEERTSTLLFFLSSNGNRRIENEQVC